MARKDVMFIALVAASARSRVVTHLPVDASQHRRLDDFPEQLLDELRSALCGYAARRADDELKLVQCALKPLCSDAHRRGLGPERVVVAVKEGWASLPQTQHTRDRSPRETEALHALFERVLTACLDSYFSCPEADK